MEKNLRLKAGNCNHRRYFPKLPGIVRTGQFDPSASSTPARKIKVEIMPAA